MDLSLPVFEDKVMANSHSAISPPAKIGSGDQCLPIIEVLFMEIKNLFVC